MARILICDNEEEYKEILAKKISKAVSKNLKTQYIIDSCSSLDELKEKLETGKVDIVFLDIMINSKSSVDWLIENKSLSDTAQFIIITAFPVESYKISETDSCYFLIKQKMTDELLLNAIKKATQNIIDNENNLKTVKSGNSVLKINLKKVTYVESFNNNIVIHTVTGNDYNVYSSLKSFSKDLLPSFLRCHRSFMVNMDYIVGYEPYNFILKDESHVQISPRSFNKIINEYRKYLLNS